MPVLTAADLPEPEVETAFMDNNRRIWLWMPDPPSSTGKWRLPGGSLSKDPRLISIYMERNGVTSLRKMLPVRRR